MLDMLAVAILVVMVLYLVDKNQVWAQFWRTLKWGTVVAIVGGACFFGYLEYQERKVAAAQSKSQQIDWSQYEEKPSEGDVFDRVADEPTTSPRPSSPSSPAPAHRPTPKSDHPAKPNGNE